MQNVGIDIGANRLLSRLMWDFELLDDTGPVMPPALWNDWLTAEPARALELLAAVPESELAYYPVSKAVGSPRNSTPDLVEPIAG